MEVGGYIGVDGVFGMDGMPCLEAARKNSCSISSRCLPCSEAAVKGGRGGVHRGEVGAVAFGIMGGSHLVPRLHGMSVGT